jgi:dTDP-4-dehydrorhamnose reductase
MQQRVLITGGSGLLALNWAQAMRKHCAITLGLHDRDISLSGTYSRNIDLESEDKLTRVFEELECQVVIHAAGLTSVERCESEPSLAQHVNVTLAENVAKACAALGINLVHVSSDHLFPGQEPLVTEDQLVAPLNVYGKTKAEAELRVREKNPQALLIRTNFFGWGTSYRNSFSDFVIQALRSGKEVTLYQDIFYTPILIETAAKAVHDLIDLKVEGGIFNIVGDDRVSKYDFGIAIADKFNLDPSGIVPGLFTNQPALTQRPFDMSLSNNKVISLLGRPVGGLQEQVALLHQQELTGLAQEIRRL